MKIILFLFLITSFTFSKGIVIADDGQILKDFRDASPSQVLKIVDNIISTGYNKVILHIGKEYPFKRGNLFFYDTSQRNLKILYKQLNSKGVKLYLWYLDSFGVEDFNKLYKNYRTAITETFKFMEDKNIKYDGIVVDMEWINLKEGNNNKRYIEILRYLKKFTKDKKVFAFMSLVNDENENKRRGYDEFESLQYLDNIIEMLYIKDSGYKIVKNKLELDLKTNRIKELKRYFKKKKYELCISKEGGIFLQRRNNAYFIKTSNKISDNTLKNLKRTYSKNYLYYRVKGYKARNDFNLIRNDGLLEKIKKGELLHFLEIKDKLIKENDYIWEYFQILK